MLFIIYILILRSYSFDYVVMFLFIWLTVNPDLSGASVILLSLSLSCYLCFASGPLVDSSHVLPLIVRTCEVPCVPDHLAD